MAANAAPAQGRSIKPLGTRNSEGARLLSREPLALPGGDVYPFLPFDCAAKVCGVHLWVRAVQAET
jgi:hypothetical protein